MMKKCVCRELNLSNATEFYGHFIFTSLEPGEGLTLGNMIRRTLLSSLVGSKIVGVKMKNINHEFSDLEGIREDILEIFLNLKDVIIKSPVEYGICYGKLRIEGPAIVTAGSIKLPDGIKIINPYQYLFTISENLIIELEVKIESGKSYMLATDRKIDSKNEFFPIDANFSPIINVDYYIQSVTEYIEQSFEELHLIIYTNGTLLPQEALLLATNNLSQLILGCRNIELLHSKSKLNKIVDSNLQRQIKEKEFVQQVENKNLEELFEEKKLQNPDLNESESFKEILFKQKSSDVDDINGQSLQKSLITKKERLKQFSKNRNQINAKQNSILVKEDRSKKKKPIRQQQTEQNLNLSPGIINSNLSIIETQNNLTNSNFISTSTKTLDLRTIDIEITCLPTRILTILRKADIYVMADLLKYSLVDLEKIKGLGPISIKKIKNQVDLFFEAISL